MPSSPQSSKQRMSTPLRSTFGNLSLGLVVDTNDPRQMGRIRVMCPSYGDRPDDPYLDIPWCLYVSPFGGMTDVTTRGPTGNAEQEKTNGPVAYGMFNVPKVGAQALVACIDGDGDIRVWLGCLHAPLMDHTMPHGNFSYQQDTDLPENGKGLPDGPLSSQDEPIEPLYSNQQAAFTPREGDISPSQSARQSFEFRTRISDRSVGGLTENTLDQALHSFLQDDQDIEFTEEDGSLLYNTQGYDLSRIEPDLIATPRTKYVNYDPQTYSWVTPGFHAISMDDRVSNCRMRFRTTSGHQLILDDTNERMYISTAEGETWIELDQKGNIDIYAGRNLSVRAEGDINFTTDQTFRVKAKEGIHMFSEGEARIHSAGDMSIRTETDMDIYANATLQMSSDDRMDVFSDKAMFISTNDALSVTSVENMSFGTQAEYHVVSGATMFLHSTTEMNVRSENTMRLTGEQIWLNSSDEEAEAATPAVAGDPADIIHAFWTSRVPQHEPWARNFMKKGSDTEPGADRTQGNSHVPEYEYKSKDVGRVSVERDEDFNRNPNWHR